MMIFNTTLLQHLAVPPVVCFLRLAVLLPDASDAFLQLFAWSYHHLHLGMAQNYQPYS